MALDLRIDECPSSPGRTCLVASLKKNDYPVGLMAFGGGEPTELKVVSKYRGKGVSQALYKYAGQMGVSGNE